MMRLVYVALVLAAGGCAYVPATYQVSVTAETRELILAQPEFATVDCGELRTTVVGADIANGHLLLSINCVDF